MHSAPSAQAQQAQGGTHRLTASGFSPAGASFLALRSFLISARALRLRPRWNLLAAGKQDAVASEQRRVDCIYGSALSHGSGSAAPCAGRPFARGTPPAVSTIWGYGSRRVGRLSLPL